MKTLLKILALPFVALIKIYQWILSPLLGPKCRFTPTCSHYALEAFRKYGLFKGFWLSILEERWKFAAHADHDKAVAEASSISLFVD